MATWNHTREPVRAISPHSAPMLRGLIRDSARYLLNKKFLQTFAGNCSLIAMATPYPARAKAPAGSPTTPSRSRSGHRTLVVAGVLAIVAGAIALIYTRLSPFSEKSVSEDLSEVSDSTVRIGRYRQTFLPTPGCVLEDVEFRHGPDHSRFITIDRVVIEGSYGALLKHQVPTITTAGAHVFIPPFGRNWTFKSQPSTTSVGQIIAQETIVEFQSSTPNSAPLTFAVHRAVLHDVRSSAAIGYELHFRNPTPPGDISVHGKFGPWPENHAEESPFSGEYTFDGADLSSFGGIGGILTSHGHFDGPLRKIKIAGTTDVPDFQVKSSTHKIHVATRFDAYVDAMHGDTFLSNVEAQVGHTTLLAQGSVARTPGHNGKFTDLRLIAQNGRIEDILDLFIKAPRSPMSGPISFRAGVQIAPSDQPFLKKVDLHGQFGIDKGSFSKAETQQDVNKLSAGARGQSKEDPATVMTDMTGNVRLSSGVARFSELSFSVPGAHAKLHGTYNVIDERIDLHGNMRVDTEISKTTSGIRSFFLKVMDPFFKKKKKGEIVPVHILGTYDKPQFGLDIAGKK